MKRGTIRHPKLLHLAALLELRPYEALGLLEALLDWAFDYARRGNVGRFANAAIATGIGWPGDPERLVAALVTARWLDVCAMHRLVIHDLGEHASDSWKKLMQRQHLEFAIPTPPSSGLVRNLSGQVPDLSAPPAPRHATPSLSLASLAPASAPGFDDFWQRYPLHVGKQAARKAWGKLGPSPPLGTIVDALAWQRELPRWREEGGRYVPHPATYLNGRRWEDERPPPTALERFAAEGETG
jgi:hypothetical protein